MILGSWCISRMAINVGNSNSGHRFPQTRSIDHVIWTLFTLCCILIGIDTDYKHITQGYVIAVRATKRLPMCHWSNPGWNELIKGPLARYVKLGVAHAPGMPGTFSPPTLVRDPDMHHGTCVTHVSWCMPGSLTGGFLWSRWRGKTFPAFPAHAQPTILRIWQEVHHTHR